jgi:hypothetical protein
VLHGVVQFRPAQCWTKICEDAPRFGNSHDSHDDKEFSYAQAPGCRSGLSKQENLCEIYYKNSFDETTRSAEEWEVVELGVNVPRNCAYTPLHKVLTATVHVVVPRRGGRRIQLERQDGNSSL